MYSMCMCCIVLFTGMNCNTDDVFRIAAGFQSLVQLVCEKKICHLGVAISLIKHVCMYVGTTIKPSQSFTTYIHTYMQLKNLTYIHINISVLFDPIELWGEQYIGTYMHTYIHT